MITKEQMSAAMPTAAKAGRVEKWYDPLIAAMQRCDITTVNRQVFFLANLAEETGELKEMVENLNYSAERLIEVFPSMFANRPALAHELAAKGPEAIANFIYADENRPAGYKMGNVKPGDGWRNRGRGPMMITGDGNYRAYFRSVGLPEDSDRDLLLQPEHGALSAALYWKRTGCNGSADQNNFIDAVIRVNGGTTNLEKREFYRNRFAAVMSSTPETLKRGSFGNPVVALQRALQTCGFYRGMLLDGDFGPATEKAVKEFQSSVGLTVDGVVGPATRKALNI